MNAISGMCSELASYLINCGIRIKKSDYKTLSEAILDKYEILFGILYRKVYSDFKNKITKAYIQPYVII